MAETQTQPDPIRILLRLKGGYGLGDYVQFGVILKHLRKYRPNWIVTVQAMRGPHSALVGLCHAVVYDDPPIKDFDKIVSLDLEDSFLHFADRPSSKVVFNLRLQFGLEYDPECGGYEIQATSEVVARAHRYLETVAYESFSGKIGTISPVKFKAIPFHYYGGSSKARKDLEHWQAEVIVDAIKQAERTPILLDWSHSPIKAARVPDRVWGGFGNGDAATMAAMIRLSEAFIGIDSGPGKVASATDTPSLIVWTKHHPARYHDPAPNTTHLIPTDWRGMQPIEWDAEREKFFEENYRYRTYRGEHGLVAEVVRWLQETLGWTDWVDAGVQFVIPARLASAAWVMAKVRNIAGGRTADCIVSSSQRDRDAEEVADFVRSFGYFRRVWVGPIEVHMGPDRPQNTRGHYLYVSDGMRGPYYYLCPDAIQQLGKPLTDWLPDVPVDFEMVQRMQATESYSEFREAGGA